MTGHPNSEFLIGKTLADRIRAICAADDVDCAVAFLGTNMSADLFQGSGQRIRIVCDIAMGATSREALEEFGAPNNKKLRVHDWIHTKVYISEVGLIVGSPNMSSYGLGLQGKRPRSLEAGIFHPAGSPAWKEAKDWFNELFDAATIIGNRELNRAPPYVREPGPTTDRKKLKGLSLLERLTIDLGLFADVSFIVTSVDLDPEEQSRLIAEEPDGILSDDVEVVVYDDDLPLNKPGGLVIGFHTDGDGVRHVNGYVRCLPSMRTDRLCIFGVDNWEGVIKQLRQPDLKRACELNWDIIDEMDSSKAIFTPAAFKAALSAAESIDQLI